MDEKIRKYLLDIPASIDAIDAISLHLGKKRDFIAYQNPLNNPCFSFSFLFFGDFHQVFHCYFRIHSVFVISPSYSGLLIPIWRTFPSFMLW